MEIEERKRLERDQREEAIVSAAERLFFASGYDAVTMDDIAKEAGFTKRTVYAYVGSKERLALAISLRGYRLLNAAIGEALQTPTASGLERFKAVAGAILGFVEGSPGYFDVITDYAPTEGDFSAEDRLAADCYREGERALVEIRAAVRFGLSDGSIRSTVDPVRSTFLLWAMLVGYRRIARLKTAYLAQLHPEAGALPSSLLHDIEGMIKA